MWTVPHIPSSSSTSQKVLKLASTHKGSSSRSSNPLDFLLPQLVATLQRQEGANLKFAYARNLTLMEKVELSCQALDWWTDEWCNRLYFWFQQIFREMQKSTVTNQSISITILYHVRVDSWHCFLGDLEVNLGFNRLSNSQGVTMDSYQLPAMSISLELGSWLVLYIRE